jgi:ferric-dicitrate binding protein FerR (iron transport regulator)
MKKDTQNNNAPITSLPDDLHSVWELTGKLKKDRIVSEQETEQALQNIWASVDEAPQQQRSFTMHYLVAAVTLIAATVGFLNFFTIQKTSLPGEISVIELRDGSTITLTGNSSIEYSPLFGFTNRNIELDGHAYFDVESNYQLPFIIESPSLITEVLGTIFEIEDWGNAIHTTPSVLVHEGIVEVSNDLTTVTLTEKEEVELINEVLVENSSDLNTDQFRNWNEARVNFKNVPLDLFLERLSLQFGTSIQIDNSINTKDAVSGSYRFDTSLEEILIDVSTIKNFSFQRTINGFVIR